MGQYCVIGLGSFGYFLATKPTFRVRWSGRLRPNMSIPIPDGSFVIKDSGCLFIMVRDEDIRRVKGT